MDLIKSLKDRLAGQEYFLANGGQKSYDLCADSGYNEAVKNEIEFLTNLLYEFEQ